MPNMIRARVNVVTGNMDDVADYNRNAGYVKGIHVVTGRGPLGLVQIIKDANDIRAGWIVQRSGARQVSISPRGALPKAEDFISVPIEVKNETDEDIEEGNLQLQVDVEIGGITYSVPVVMRGYVDGSSPIPIAKGETYTTTGLFVAKALEDKQATLYFTKTKPGPLKNWSVSPATPLKAGETISLTLSGSGNSGGVPIPPPIEIGGLGD